MKKLGIFSRIEKGLYYSLYTLFIIIFPLLVLYIIDKIFPVEELDWFIRYPILIVGYLVALLICVGVGGSIVDSLETFNNSIRKLFKQKPLRELEKEIRDGKNHREYEEWEKEWERDRKCFYGKSTDDKLYELYLEQKQFKNLFDKQIGALDKIVMMLWIILFLVAVVAIKIKYF